MRTAASSSLGRTISCKGCTSVEGNHKNEGASGDIYENKGARKCMRTGWQKERPRRRTVNAAAREMVAILNSVSCLLASDSKNEGDSGDVDENKGATKSTRAKFQAKLPGDANSTACDKRRVAILNSVSCLLTSLSKNEGDSGDVHENKGARKCTRAKATRSCLGTPTSQPATSRKVAIPNSVSCLLTSLSKNEGDSGDVHENK